MSELDSKYKQLDELEVEDDIHTRKLSIAQKKALEAEAKAKYGKDWKKILGITKLGKGIINQEALHSLYAADLGGLKDLNKPFRGQRV